MNHFLTKALIALLLLWMQQTAYAEQFKRFADYDVHYSVFNSTFISAKVAKTYNIVRGNNRGIVNIAVRKRLRSGQDVAQHAVVSGSSTNLIHRKPLEFQEIKEQQSIYYIAEFDYDDKDMRHFDIRVQPNPKVAPYRLKFTKSLYNK